MTGPAYALQKGIYDGLTGSAALAAAAGGAVRAYDRVDDLPVFPYFTISDVQLLDDGNTCESDMYEAFSDVHVWSRDVGSPEAKALADIVRSILLGPLSLPGWEITSATVQSIRHLTDPDGLTAHGVVTTRFLLQTA
jgi:hypothetical protein